ncbi:uncharacterized protein [Panulirus ornatus]|uniref:uncharacterized protein n=1 Tax=Panulirus ornatus TaxID=150431 RepID=UPI003A853B0E
MMWSLGNMGVTLILACLIFASADDRVTCCMGGWKMLRGVRLCDAPCCPGYEERVVDLPLLNSPAICHKLTQEELRQKEKQEEEEEAMRTTLAPPPDGMLHDGPRRKTRASSEYADFLYHHRHFFLRLLNQGYSRKDLLTKLEKFLEHLSSVVYQPDWFTK